MAAPESDPAVRGALKRALVFGASGQIGDALLPVLRESGCDVLAVSRQSRPDQDGLHWIAGALGDGLSIPAQACDVVFSLGPLDLFARWIGRVGPVAPRVIAFGSTSIDTKSDSSDPAERDIAERLRMAEEMLFEFGGKHGIGVTVLRPTLIYGRGRDRSLSRIAAVALRYGWFALPGNATGLRQPVHADDLAHAAVAAARSSIVDGRAYDVPGGEALPYREMVARVLAVLDPRPRLLRFPSPLFQLAVAVAKRLAVIDAVNPALLARMDIDQVFDPADAHRDFGYAPRAFAPDARMFTTR